MTVDRLRDKCSKAQLKNLDTTNEIQYTCEGDEEENEMWRRLLNFVVRMKRERIGFGEQKRKESIESKMRRLNG